MNIEEMAQEAKKVVLERIEHARTLADFVPAYSKNTNTYYGKVGNVMVRISDEQINSVELSWVRHKYKRFISCQRIVSFHFAYWWNVEQACQENCTIPNCKQYCLNCSQVDNKFVEDFVKTFSK